MKPGNILTVIALALVLLCAYAYAASTSVLKVDELDNSLTYYGETKYIGTDTTNVNQVLVSAFGAFNGAIKYRVRAGGGAWSGWALIDSFSTTKGTVTLYDGMTTDSIMRHGMPPLDAPSDSNQVGARSYFKQIEKYFEWQIYVETASSGNSGILNVIWID